ncbi:MAG: hypothetical protein IKJ80_04470 [Clostridia bacterium]|nr:hypothetical protein [Clostridia bacterium]
MSIMFLDKSEERAVDFDVKAEIVSKDKFFESAKKYISVDEKTVLHRQALFSDVLKNAELESFLFSLAEKMNEYSALARPNGKDENNEVKIYNILYPTVYIELVRFIYDSLSPIMASVTSVAVKNLYELARTDINSDEYRRIKEYYDKNSRKLRLVKSVTIGVNLNAMYQPKEAGIVALNEEEYRSGDLLDRIMRADFKRDDFHCIAPITVIDKKLGFSDSQQVNFAFLKAMGDVLDSGLYHCSSRLLKYARGKLAQYFDMLDSMDFLVEAIKRIKVFKEKKIPLCFPKINHDGEFNVVSLYDNSLCVKKEKSEIVANTVKLEGGVCCYILTGPNSGGKSVFANSLAAAQYYFQLGMPIPAREASLPICDYIFKISVEEQVGAELVGRFERECILLSDTLGKFTKNSLALIDEAFTSTSAAEAVPIAANFISEMCKIGGKCVFITHYHELCEEQARIRECGDKVGYLHTEAQGDRRTYAVQSGKADSGSYAQSIAKKYGLI